MSINPDLKHMVIGLEHDDPKRIAYFRGITEEMRRKQNMKNNRIKRNRKKRKKR